MTGHLDVGDFTTRSVPLATVPRVYGDALIDLAQNRPEVVCLSGDLTASTETDRFRDAYPDRFYNFGIAEANMVGASAGMARSGDIPFVHSFSVFLTRRCHDQVAMQLAYPRTNVKLVGFLPGLTTALGVSHQAIDDIALMRVLPNMTVIEPGDIGQIRDAVFAAADLPGPVYLRMRRSEVALSPTTPTRQFQPGHGELLRQGSDGVIFSCGLMVGMALHAAERLATSGRQVAVANIHTIKPLDSRFVLDLVRSRPAVVTAENHSIIGGLGSAIAETVTDAGLLIALSRVGIGDCFAEGGSTSFLFAKYGLTAEHIEQAYLRSETLSSRKT